MKNFFVLVLFLTSFTFLYSQTSVPIQSIRLNDANGVPLMNNQVVTVSGIVTCSNQYGSAGPGAIEDETGGVSVYGSTFCNSVAIGDSVTVTATLTNYNGLAELSFSVGTSSFTVHSSNNQVDPKVVTLTQVINQQWNGFEEFESRLIRINNVTINASGNFATGTNYDITDATGNIIQGLRIDNDVATIIGTQIPTGEVDLIGILGQFKTTAPYNSGYQILPRFILDIVNDGSPVVLNPVFAAGIDTSSFSVFFHTARNGNSQVKYGLTTALELDSIVINNDTTFHAVPVTGLQQGRLYYFKAYSTNQYGTSSSDLKSVTTASNDTSIGTINVYFNFSVDPSVAISGNQAKGNVDFEQKLIERINLAKYSIDLALYSFSDKPNVANALVVAKNRGVKVRVVYDSRPTQNSMQTLIDNGILISKRPPDTQTFNGIMHNKFFIFDARDTIVTNDWVWTGSWNVTALESGWKNNIVEINDPTIAQAYTLEFEEMWGSSTDTPNPLNAKFGIMKSNNTPHVFTIGGRPVQLYFSPTDGTTSQIINQVNRTDYDMYFAQYVFTRYDIALAMNQKNSSGVTDFRGVIDQPNTSGSQYSYLSTFTDLYTATAETQHHKYAIFDASYSKSDPTVITGSHNWSNAAEQDNDENTLIIDDVYIANQYMQEFKKRYNEAGGTGAFLIPVTDVSDNHISEFNYQLFQNYPNPFNPITAIKFEIPKSQNIQLAVYDILGREVRVLYSGFVQAGIIAIDFKADDLASGMYIYRLKTDEFSASKKMILLK
jgi:hypothetical protein